MRIALVCDTAWDLAPVTQWATHRGLTVETATGLVVWVRADPAGIADALGIHWADTPTGWHTDDTPTVPFGVRAVSGLSTHGQLWHHGIRVDTLPPIKTAGHVGYAPDQIRTAYHVQGAAETGRGQIIGLAQWGQVPDATAIATFCQEAGLPPPALEQVAVGDITGLPTGIEATLDGEWAAAIAPQATLRYYIAPAGTDDTAWGAQVTALLHAVWTDAIVPTVLSISYGDGEDQLPAQDLQAWAHLIAQITARGTTVVVSAGDSGTYGMHLMNMTQQARVEAPASCPAALAVGGTALYMALDQYEAERAWENRVNLGATGGGYSAVFARPAYQDGLPTPPPMRAVPDVAAVADVTTPVRTYIEGQWTLSGGTSVAAPIVAGLLACAAERAGHPFGALHDWLYQWGSQVCRDITDGNNQCYAVPGLTAGPGWDPVTGWGAILYDALIAHLPPGPAGASNPPVDPATLTVQELATAPDGQFGAALIPLQDAARTVQAAAEAVGQDAVAAFSQHPVGYFDAIQRAAARLWVAGVHH